MKYLIVIVVVVAVWMLTRNRRIARSTARTRADGTAPQAMVRCSHCGVYLPRAESLASDFGAFCSEEHRLASPRAN